MKDFLENSKVVYNGEDNSFQVDNEFTKKHLVKGKIYTVSYTIIDELGISSTVCLEECSSYDWDICFFDSINDYLKKQLAKNNFINISVKDEDGILIGKVTNIKNIKEDGQYIKFYNKENNFVGEVNIDFINHIEVNSNDITIS